MPESLSERAIMLALAALYDVAKEAHAAPLPPSLEVRAVLALLHALSNGTREPYEAFWRASRDPGLATDHASAQGYMRSTMMRIELQGIARSLGIEPQSQDFHDRIARLRE